ncbi:aminotransferase class V-fold PLP-dependent enzyme [Spongiivirga citrea]|uniref:Aminotransferase class V-fold PLP-dependent enzyme n=1 Tax=Spongiivirga citrea TaxID=1481457 RepID=A0A6M0CM84_9FLAO|nr:aminotransferase class V-fold PLP-dependent enzyme [Spongiivirga citrea]NER18073.1 aminotransferase class V-fold PLP-dependent enzyme [Spongiivirga citrea]
MKSQSRRKFIQSLTSGAAASVALPSLAFASINENFETSFKQVFDTTYTDEEAFWKAIKKQFKFADGLYYFNNASLGSSSIPIQQATNTFRETLDGFPSKYMWGGWNDEKEITRKQVADLFSVSEEEIALTHNTTEGMNLIARSFDLKAGDEVILADHEHASGTIPWEVWQETKGIKLIRPTLPSLPKSIDEVVAVFKKAISPRTKVISMCHIVNTNGMILPVKEVSKLAHKNGILVAVDGAQSAGMFTIDLHDLGCDFYTASAHKWLFAPKGIGVFYAKQESQHHLKPLMVARGYTDTSIRRLENYNTRNLPELLGLGASVKFHNEIGAKKITERSFELKSYFRSKVENNTKFKLKTPELDSLSSAIQVVEVVGKNVRDVKRRLFDEFGIDCRPMSGFGLNALRLSFAMYITKKDIDYLVNALEKVAE